MASKLLPNLGLWKGVPDIHAVDRIGLERCEFPEARLLHENVILPEGTATCLCAGSMQLHREVIPAIYQLPMMIEIFPGWPLDRLGDIWAGYILKTLMDIRGERMSVGGPLVRHLRIGPLQQNLRREHLGHLVNEEFIDLLTHLRGEIESGDYQEMMAQLQELFARNAHKASPILCAYLSKLQSPLSAWIAALRS